jgi:amino acid permease
VGALVSLFVCEIGYFAVTITHTLKQLAAAVFVNIFPSRVYGEMEFWFSTIKVVTIVVISGFTHTAI